MLNIRHLAGAVLLFHNGLIKILTESEDFYELEKRIGELCQRASNQTLVWALEQMARHGKWMVHFCKSQVFVR
jgi:hypothetical protein